MYPTYTPFLEEIARKIHKEYQHELDKLTIIVPNHHVVLFLQRYLAQNRNKPIWLPNIMSSDHFIQALSPLEKVPTLILTHTLYETFNGFQHHKESFAQFYTWGTMLLEDFNSIDKELVEAEHLFQPIYGGQEEVASYTYLTHSQRSAILSFWKNFHHPFSKEQTQFLQLWEILPSIYHQFKKKLLEKKEAYQGLCYRTAWEAITTSAVLLPDTPLIFIGFNALSKVEEELFCWCKTNREATFFWDIDNYYMQDTDQEGGLYLRSYQQNPILGKTFPITYPHHIAHLEKKIQLIDVPSEVGQVQIIINHLQQIIKREGPLFNPTKTVIIVDNEALLLPLLHTLPSIPYPIHISSGYSLTYTAVYNILAQLLALQQKIDNKTYPTGYLSTNDVLVIIKQLQKLLPDYIISTNSINSDMFKNAYIAQDEIVNNYKIIGTLFQPLTTTDTIVPYVDNYIALVQEQLAKRQDPIAVINKLACRHIAQQLIDFQIIFNKKGTLIDCTKLLLQVLKKGRLPFSTGASATGIQVMDILATTALDFEHVLILGMNEGTIPYNKEGKSFIPYSLSKGYNLPISSQIQANYAYHFYRLLQRAKDIFITYSTKSILGGQQEMSRFLSQICYESNLAIKQEHIVPITSHPSPSSIIIHKDPILQEQLSHFLVDKKSSTKVFTPSALNTYLSCSLRFYFQYIAKLHIAEKRPSVIDTRYFGTILHVVMEKLYAPFLQTKEALEGASVIELKKNIPKAIQEALLSVIAPEQPDLLAALAHKYTIIQAIIAELIKRILAIDASYAPFSLIGLEVGRQTPLRQPLKLDDTKTVLLGGIIDRIDKKEQIMRVIDYKTGNTHNRFSSIDALFLSDTVKQNPAVLQILFYAWLFKKNYTGNPVAIMPGIINSKAIFKHPFDPRLFIKEEGSHTYTPIHNIADYEYSLEKNIRKVLKEIFDVTIPFSQTEVIQNCKNCPYKDICQRS